MAIPTTGMGTYVLKEYVATMYHNPEGIYEPLIRKEEEKPLIKGSADISRVDKTLYVPTTGLEVLEDDEEPEEPCKHTQRDEPIVAKEIILSP